MAFKLKNKGNKMDEIIEIKKENKDISETNKSEKIKNKKIKKFKQKMAKIDKNKKTGVFKALALIWSFMGKKEKIMFISIFCFSLISAFCMMFQNVIPSLVLAQLVGEKVKFLFFDFTGMQTIPLVITLCGIQIGLWVFGMLDYYLVDIFARRMICVINVRAQDMLLLERKNLDYGMTNGEVNYIVKNATDCIYQILEPFCWSIATHIITVLFMTISLFFIDYVVGLCTIANIALILLCVFIRIKVQKPIVEKIENTNAKIGNQFLTSIQNLPLITMQKSKAEEERHLGILNTKFYKNHKRRAAVGFWYWIAITAIEYAGLALSVAVFILRNNSEYIIASITLIFTLSASIQSYIEQWGYQICDVLNASIKLCNLNLLKPDQNTLKEANDDKFEKLSNSQITSIDANNVKVSIGRFEGSYSAHFESGKIYLLSGRSGKGKTTFINALCGLREIKSGEIIVNGQYKLTSLFDYSQKISYMFQDSILFDRSIKENISYPNKELNEEALRLIEVFGMEKIVEREIVDGSTSKTLSGGEKKRIDFIRSMAKEADIYIFDEPTNELDKVNVEKVIEEISTLREKGKIAIVISHDKRISSFADEIIEF